MNYMYQLNGIPVIGNGTEGDRYHLERYYLLGVACDDLDDYGLLALGPLASGMVIDFSTGVGLGVPEASVNETTGLRRPTSTAVDFDCSGTITSGVAIDLNSDGFGTVLTDHDDWGNLDLAFLRSWGGNDSLTTSNRRRRATLDPLAYDRQPLATEEAPSLAFFAALRAGRY